jgi:hypothetical protein
MNETNNGCEESRTGTLGDSLLDRVRMRADRARRESAKYERLYELHALLGRYPDVARILELMEEM